MKRRFWKSETNRTTRSRTADGLAVLLSVTSLLAFSTTSCGVLEMREATSEIRSREETASPTLQQADKYSLAEKYSAAEKASDEGAMSASKPETDVVETPAKRISLAAVGGVIVDEEIIADAAARAVEGKEFSFLTMYSSVYPMIQNADMAMVTLHSPAADRDAFGLSDQTHTNMPTDSVTALAELGFDVANVAGVDRLVCGAEGLASTVENTGDADMLVIGTHTDEIDAGDVRILEVDGIRVAFIAFTENANSDTNGLILHDLTDEAAAASLVTYADLISDVVIASVTWDNSTTGSIRVEQKTAAQMLAEAGADVVIGSNGLGLQTAEWLTTEDESKTFVAYSLGNFMGTGNDAASILGGILAFDVVAEEAGMVLDNVTIHPIVKHYEVGNTGYQVAELAKYAPELAAVHGAGGLTMEAMQSVVNGIIPAEFLPGKGE